MNRHLLAAGDLTRDDAILVLDTAEELARVVSPRAYCCTKRVMYGSTW